MLINDIFEMTETERNALTDAQIVGLEYGIRYFSIEAGPEARHQMNVLRELNIRLEKLRAAMVASPKPAIRHDYPTGRTLDCGCTVYDKHEVMNASTGSACESCYDRMS